jgi:hypothetical protein
MLCVATGFSSNVDHQQIQASIMTNTVLCNICWSALLRPSAISKRRHSHGDYLLSLSLSLSLSLPPQTTTVPTSFACMHVGVL